MDRAEAVGEIVETIQPIYKMMLEDDIPSILTSIRDELREANRLKSLELNLRHDYDEFEYVGDSP